jgi:hypothetical protein
MDTDPTYQIVLAELLNNENNSSHIYLLKQTLQNSIDDFVEGYNIWEKKKADIINKMALTLEKLHFLGEYTDPLNTISSYIRKKLAERGVSEGQLNYINEVLPLKYKNENLVREKGGKEILADSINNNNNNNDQQIIPLVNSQTLLRKLENIAVTSPTEYQNYGIEMDQKQKHIRNNMKTEKELYEYVAIKHKVPVPRYKKESSEVPPQHLQGATTMYNKIKEMSATVFDIYKYLEDIAKSVYEFPPDNELAAKCANKLDIFDKTVLQTIKLMLVPYTDKKYSGDWIKWCDINLTRLEQSKNYAGSKHALETGEFAIKLGKDGKEIILSLDRGITREQVGDREPDIYLMARQVLLGNQAISAFNEWSYNTNIMEEYDQDGNPIIDRKE